MVPYLILIVTTILVGLAAVLLYRRKDTPDPKVFLQKLADSYQEPVRQGLDQVGFFEEVRPGATVFLKPRGAVLTV